MSKYDSPNHAQFYIGVDGGRTSCRAFPRLKLAGALFLARRRTSSNRAEVAEEGAQICPLST
jgi:N-acetylglucosamine kinase-like BadF-type ATPase